MDTINSLTQMGLGEKQAKVYLSLLELGEAGVRYPFFKTENQLINSILA